MKSVSIILHGYPCLHDENAYIKWGDDDDDYGRT